jgi:hypothetical protein
MEPGIFGKSNVLDVSLILLVPFQFIAAGASSSKIGL